jgi:hypothetical protein
VDIDGRGRRPRPAITEVRECSFFPQVAHTIFSPIKIFKNMIQLNSRNSSSHNLNNSLTRIFSVNIALSERFQYIFVSLNRVSITRIPL